MVAYALGFFGLAIPHRVIALQYKELSVFDRLSSYAPQALAVLRIVAALLFLLHGTQKLLGFPAAEFAPPAFSIFWFAGVIEIITGVMMLVGFFTRPLFGQVTELGGVRLAVRRPHQR